MTRFTDEEIGRYGRQMVLPEVGGIGQERLRASSVRARSEVEALYLAGAGVGRLAVPTLAIAEAARALNPLVEVAIDERIADERVAEERANLDERGDVEAAALAAVATLKRILGL
jgi:molybdopterin/thiamine biosynthesis adenylyltransferase